MPPRQGTAWRWRSCCRSSIRSSCRICGAIALDQGADAAQEALLQILRDLGQLRDPQRLVPWARRIAARAAVRIARRQRERAPAVLEPSASPAADDPELAAAVRAMLARLARLAKDGERTRTPR